MFKKILLILSALTLIVGCKTMQVYESPQNEETSKITVNRDMEPFLLASLTTSIFKLAEQRACGGNLNLEEDKQFIRLNKGNPLISNINESGVNVQPHEPLILRVQTNSGVDLGCSRSVEFTPDSNKNYEIKLSGQVNFRPYECSVELWSTEKATNLIKQEEFEQYYDCSS